VTDAQILETITAGAKLADLRAQLGYRGAIDFLIRNGLTYDGDDNITKQPAPPAEQPKPTPTAKPIVAKKPAEPEPPREEQKPAAPVEAKPRGFRPNNASEIWAQCVAPFARYMVSNCRRVAWAHTGKLVTPRDQTVYAKNPRTDKLVPKPVQTVRLYQDDGGGRREVYTSYLWQNASGAQKIKPTAGDVQRLAAAGNSVRKIAKRLRLSKSAVQRLKTSGQ